MGTAVCAEEGADIPLYLRMFLPMDVSEGRTQHESPSPQAGIRPQRSSATGIVGSTANCPQIEILRRCRAIASTCAFSAPSAQTCRLENSRSSSLPLSPLQANEVLRLDLPKSHPTDRDTWV